ncbi:MAG: hypothetical protein ABIO72_03550 [Patescibacteria group bacterium]
MEEKENEQDIARVEGCSGSARRSQWDMDRCCCRAWAKNVSVKTASKPEQLPGFFLLREVRSIDRRAIFWYENKVLIPSLEVQMPKPEKNIPRKRVQLDLSSDRYKKLVAITERSGENRTYVDVVISALELYEWYLEKKDAGHKLFIEKDGKYSEVVILR